MTSRSQRVHGLDTLRSLAIVSVMLFHVLGYGGDGKLADWLIPVARFGWMGVDLFFVLSGYLIGSQLLKAYRGGTRPSLWRFYRNRFYRVLPAYLVVLALYYMVPAWPEDHTLSPVWEYLTFTLNLLIDYANNQGFSHGWSLCVEEHFYLLLPLLALVLMRRPAAWKAVAVVAGLVLGEIALRAFFVFHVLRPAAADGDFPAMLYMERIYYPTYSRLDGLVAGVVLAAVRTSRPVWWDALMRRGHAAFFGGAGLVAAAVGMFKDRFHSLSGWAAAGDVIGYPVLSLGLGLVVASAMSENGVLGRVKVPGARLMATLAYSLYLTHKEMIHLIGLWYPRLETWGGWRWGVVYAVCSMGVASLLYLGVERPFLRLRDWRERRVHRPEIIGTASPGYKEVENG